MTTRPFVRWRWFGLLLAISMLAGCGGERRIESPFKATDITGADFGKRLALTDHTGRAVTLETFRGKLVVLFFGYTHCPDVCPTTLSDMAQAFALLPAQEVERVQVLFVSIDPQRDTPEILKAYVPHFHPSFLGLYGTPEAVAAAAREFKVVYRRHDTPGEIGYLVDHSAGSYVLDTRGRLRLYQPFGQPPEAIAHDLRLLLAEG